MTNTGNYTEGHLRPAPLPFPGASVETTPLHTCTHAHTQALRAAPGKVRRPPSDPRASTFRRVRLAFPLAVAGTGHRGSSRPHLPRERQRHGGAALPARPQRPQFWMGVCWRLRLCLPALITSTMTPFSSPSGARRPGREPLSGNLPPFQQLHSFNRPATH